MSDVVSFRVCELETEFLFFFLKGTHGAHSIRDLERAEGAAMHIHLFEEAIDWYEPHCKYSRFSEITRTSK